MFTQILMSLAAYVFAKHNLDTSREMLAFMDAVALVESGNNPKALGDDGKAYGAWQMHKAAMQDANEWLAKNGLPVQRQEDIKNIEVQRMLAYAYFHLCKERLSSVGLDADYGDIYLAFAMGFQGYKNHGFSKEAVPKRKKDDMNRVLNIYNQRK